MKIKNIFLLCLLTLSYTACGNSVSVDIESLDIIGTQKMVSSAYAYFLIDISYDQDHESNFFCDDSCGIGEPQLSLSVEMLEVPTGSTPELIEDEKTGFYFHPDLPGTYSISITAHLSSFLDNAYDSDSKTITQTIEVVDSDDPSLSLTDLDPASLDTRTALPFYKKSAGGFIEEDILMSPEANEMSMSFRADADEESEDNAVIYLLLDDQEYRMPLYIPIASMETFGSVIIENTENGSDRVYIGGPQDLWFEVELPEE